MKDRGSKRGQAVLQFPDIEGVAKEERSNCTEQMKHGQRNAEWKT